ncbi:MAG: hypothetical protein ACRDYD_07850 [Acidimicrobiales bacterium]
MSLEDVVVSLADVVVSLQEEIEPGGAGGQVPSDVDRLASSPSVAGRFVRDVLAAAELDEDQRRRILLTGLRALGEGSQGAPGSPGSRAWPAS